MNIRKIIIIIISILIIFGVNYLYSNVVSDKDNNIEKKGNKEVENSDIENNRYNEKIDNINKYNLIDPFEKNNKKEIKKFFGKVFNDNIYDVFSTTSGKIVFFQKDEDDFVKKGEMLVKVDDKYILNDLAKISKTKEISENSLLKLESKSPDKEDFDKIDKNIELLEIANINIVDNINKIQEDIDLENNELSKEAIEITIENIKEQRKTLLKDIELEINSTIDLLKSLFDNDVDEYFTKDTSKKTVFAYLLKDQEREKKIENLRLKLESVINRFMLEKETGILPSIDRINESVDLFFEYYDYLHFISFDILLLRDKDLVKIENKTKTGKNQLMTKKNILNKFYQTLENFDSSIKQNQKQIDSIELGVKKINSNLENSLKNLKNSLDKNNKQIEILEIEKKKIVEMYIPDTQDLEIAGLNIESIDKNIENLQLRLNDTVIYSPVSGKIIKKYIEEGSYLNPGMKIMTLETSDISKVSFYIPEEVLSKIKLRNNVKIDGKYNGIITDISDRTEDGDSKIKIEVTLSKKYNNLYIGKIVDVEMDIQLEKDVFDIPINAIFANENNENFVYILKNNKEIEIRKIELGNFKNTSVDVLKKFFKKGEKIIKNKEIVNIK